MRLIINEDASKGAIWAAHYIVAKIKEKAAKTDKPFVLGLPTGSTPIATYKELIRMNKAGEVSFKNVITFNMDEYVGLPEEHPESYHSFMWNNFFSHIDIKRDNVNILNGNAADLQARARQRTQRRLRTRAGGLRLGATLGAQLDVERVDAQLLAARSHVLCRKHGGVRRALVAVRLHLHATSHAREGLTARQVSHVHKGVVERRKDVCDAKVQTVAVNRAGHELVLLLLCQLLRLLAHFCGERCRMLKILSLEKKKIGAKQKEK